MAPRQKHGFTLVELLVTVTVLALLAGLLLPALARAKKKCRAAVCRNNLHQVGLSLNLFLADHDAFFPRAVGYDLPESPDVEAGISRYLTGQSKVVECPDGEELVTPAAIFHARYGYNAWGSGPGFHESMLGLGGAGALSPQRMAESAIVSPGEMVAFGDTAFDFGVPMGPARVNRGAEPPHAHHFGGANMIFCDAHVEFALVSRWTAQTDMARKRWNNDNLPHPETW